MTQSGVRRNRYRKMAGYAARGVRYGRVVMIPTAGDAAATKTPPEHR